MAAVDIFFLGLARAALRRERVYRDRTNPLDLPDRVLWVHTHLSRRTFLRLLNLIQPHLTRPTARAGALPPSTQLFVALKFYASGCFQLDAGYASGIHQTAAGKSIHAVSAALAARVDTFIKFPSTPQEIAAVNQGFYSIAGKHGKRAPLGSEFS